MFSNATKRIVLRGASIRLKTLINRDFNSTEGGSNVSSNILTNPVTLHIPRLSIPEFVFSKGHEFSDFVIFECPSTKRSYTFREVRNRSRNLSKIFRNKLGLNKGDVVLLLLPNLPEFQIAVLGCLEAGITVSTANSFYTPDEIARQIKDSSAKLIITSYELYSTATAASEKAQKKLPIVCIKTKQEQSLPADAIDFEQISTTILDVPDLEPPDPDALAILPYSSGTTGLPKGVRLSHYNIVANLAQNIHCSNDIVTPASGDHQDVTPAVLPMFHIYGFTVTSLAMMLRGVKVLTLSRFTPETYVQALKEYNVDFIFAAPSLILFLTMHPDVKPEYLTNLKFAFSGAAPLGASDEDRFLEKVRKDVLMLQGYGLTETAPVVTTTTKALKMEHHKASQGSIGTVVPNTQAKVVRPGDPASAPLGPGESGELLVRGPQVMNGYHNNAKATQEVFLGDWFKTGDLGHYNEHGILFITDRVKELIKVKGFQVAPAELEELLRDHPDIADAAVIGIPDAVSGEVPRAYIQLKSPLDCDEINRFVNDKVAKYKRLDGGIEFVKEIPKNATGKIMRRELKEKYIRGQNA